MNFAATECLWTTWRKVFLINTNTHTHIFGDHYSVWAIKACSRSLKASRFGAPGEVGIELNTFSFEIG